MRLKEGVIHQWSEPGPYFSQHLEPRPTPGPAPTRLLHQAQPTVTQAVALEARRQGAGEGDTESLSRPGPWSHLVCSTPLTHVVKPMSCIPKAQGVPLSKGPCSSRYFWCFYPKSWVLGCLLCSNSVPGPKAGLRANLTSVLSTIAQQ